MNHASAFPPVSPGRAREVNAAGLVCWGHKTKRFPVEPILAVRLNGESNRERTSAMHKTTAAARPMTVSAHLENGKARA